MARRPRASTIDQSAAALLGHVVRFLLKAGYSSDALLVTVKQVCEEQRARRLQARAEPQDAGKRALWQVMSVWYQSPEYCDDEGKPRVIRIRGRAPSLEDLVRRAATSFTVADAIAELAYVGCLSRLPRGRVKPLSRSAVLPKPDEAALSYMLESLTDYLSTVEHNLFEARKPVDRRYERKVTNTEIPKDAVPRFERWVHAHAQRFLETADDWLGQQVRTRAAGQGHRSSRRTRVGVGVYLIEDSRVSARSNRK